MNIVTSTDLPGLHKISQGKVRDIYEVEDKLLLVTTDRISAFDVILPEGIPYKGAVLNAISMFWFGFFKESITNHAITTDIHEMPEVLHQHADLLRGRSLLAKKADVFPVECVARGYVVGSGWKDYQATGAICGIVLPQGIEKCGKLEEPIFTPATKAESGHDENISFDTMADIIGRDNAHTLREKTLDIFCRAREYAEKCGIIIADTKLEWGVHDGEIILIDEVLTPDSSRFWPADRYNPGENQPSFDKQIVRDYLETLDWDKTYPGPKLPEDIVKRTSEKYREVYRIITTKELDA